jgi:ATP-dependent helicase HrpA
MNTDTLRQRILDDCALADRRSLLAQWRRLGRRPQPRALAALEQAVEASVGRVAARRARRPRVSLNRELPFYEYRDELRAVIAAHQVVIVCGETGSGKTTQLPQICIDLGLADRGLIGHTQPRRLAARAVTSRIAEELGSAPGQAVGYKVRFTDTTDPDGYVKLMTDGILLAETRSDRWLGEYQTLIIDEAHERSLNIDLLLGYLKQLLRRRPDLKLIITSATIDPERFSRYFDGAPMVMVSGRSYPVEIRYRPLDETGGDRDRIEAVMEAIDELWREAPQDTLVFFPGERQIREAAERVSRRFHQAQVLPLYARLNNEQQQRIFRRGGPPKIILSTNVAETSLTVPGIRYVVDTGLARISRYSWRARVQRLPIEKISRASANQRAGRCGRVAPGVCVRLYDEEDFLARPEFTEPEILRTNLASVILQMESLQLGHIRDFDFIEPPDRRLIADGYRLLHELRAVSANDRVTPLGRRLSRLSIDPRLARMLLRADELGCLAEMLVIAAVLSIQDPRDQSAENRAAANQKFALWQDGKSDFVGWVRLWQILRDQKKSLSRNQFARWCRKHYLSWMRLREWEDLYQQIREQAKALKLRFNEEPADADLLHRAILSGIPSHIAALDQDGRYKSTRGRELMIFPASVLARKTPKWIMAFALIDTSRLYAHGVAGINPQWAVQDLEHLHQYEYYEPHFQERQGRVAAFRNTRIYGLLIEGGRRVNFAAIDPAAAREIFIREGLVEGRYHSRVGFLQANRRLIERYREQEERERRRDLLIGEQQIHAFYDARIPESVVDGPSFEQWARRLDAAAIRELTLFDKDVVQGEQGRDDGAFPQYLELRGQRLRLSHVFDPADEADGVTVHIPLALLNQFGDADFEYLVPGLLGDKIEALIRSLPKPLRKHFIPVPEYARACHEALEPGEGRLLEQLSRQLRRMTGVEPRPEDWRPETIDAHFHMRYAIEKDGELLAAGRSLEQLRQDLGDEATQQFRAQTGQAPLLREGLTDWDFDDLPERIDLQQGTAPITSFPALVDYADSVAIELFESQPEADFYHASGVARLALFRLRDTVRYARKNLPQIDRSALAYAAIGSKADLVDDVLMSVLTGAMVRPPRSRRDFEQWLESLRPDFLLRANDRAGLLWKILEQWRAVRSLLEQAALPPQHHDDIEEQMAYLVYEGFLRVTPPDVLPRLPVYFQAIARRIEKYPNDAADRALPALRELWSVWLELEQEQQGDAGARERLRWMIEEWRINLFAQPMKTRQPVSEKKIRKLIAEIG